MRTNIGKTKLINRALHTIFCGLVGVVILSTFGCASTMQKAGFTDGTTYQENADKITAPAPDHGRLVLYQIKGAPNAMNGIGANSLCSVDSKVYQVMGGSYRDLELPSGKHKVTVGVKLGHPWFSKKATPGKKAVSFDLKQGNTVYCRIDLSGFGAFRSSDVVLVDAKTAIAELPPLLHMDIGHLEKYTIAE